MALVRDRYSWEVDEWREKFHDAQARLDAVQKEHEFHVSKLEQTVAWLTVKLKEANDLYEANHG